MQQTISFIVMSILIGGVIGGGTNRLAIAMLFRPHRVVRIGKHALPFTPGLIPKRRQELATQLGRTVREYLVNGEALTRTMLNTGVREKMIAWTKQEWRRAERNRHLQKWIRDFIASEEQHLQLDRELCVSDWVSPRVQKKLKKKITTWAPTINKAFIRYLASEKGSTTIRRIYGDWMRTQGWFGRLTGTLLDETKMAAKGREWLMQTLSSPQGLDATRTLLGQCVDAALHWRVRDIIDWIERQGAHENNSESSIEAMIERFVPYVLDTIVSRSDEWLDLLQLDKLVSEQIESFSLPKLEEMILRVAKKELRLITWLGALIGAVVGLAQGLVALLLW